MRAYLTRAAENLAGGRRRRRRWIRLWDNPCLPETFAYNSWILHSIPGARAKRASVVRRAVALVFSARAT